MDNNSNGNSKSIYELFDLDPSAKKQTKSGPVTLDALAKEGASIDQQLANIPMRALGYDPIGRLDAGLLVGGDQNYIRAKNQGNIEALAKTIGNIPGNVGLGLIESAGLFGELASYGVNELIGEDYDADFSNALTEWAESKKNVFGETYRYRPEETLDFRDPVWYMQNAAGLFESVAQFLALGAGIGGAALKGTGYVANAIGKSVKSARLAKGINMGAAGAGSGFTNVSLAYVEGAMSGREMYREVFKYELRKTGDREQAALKASEVAASVAKTSTALVSALSATSFLPIFQSTRIMNKANIYGLNRQAGETSRKFADRMAKSQATPPSASRGLYERFGIALESGEEAIQEVANLWAEETGRQQAGLSEFDTDGFELFTDILMTEEGLLGATLGGLGGAMQAAGMMRIPFHRRNIAKDGEEPKLRRLSRKQLNDMQLSETGASYAKVLEEDVRDVIVAQEELETAMQEGDTLGIEQAKDKLYSVSSKRSISIDGGNALKASLEEIESVDNETNLLEGLAEQLVQLEEQQGDPEQIEQVTAEIERLQEKFPDTEVVTQAMDMGLSENPEDNQFKETAKKKMGEVDQLREMYEATMNKYNYGDEAALGLAEYVYGLKIREKVNTENIERVDDFLGNLEMEIDQISESILPEDLRSDDVSESRLEKLANQGQALKERLSDLNKEKVKAKEGSPYLQHEYGSLTQGDLVKVIDEEIETIEKDLQTVNNTIAEYGEEIFAEASETMPIRENYKDALKKKDAAIRRLKHIRRRLGLIESSKGRQEFVDKAYKNYQQEQVIQEKINKKYERKEAAAKEKAEIEKTRTVLVEKAKKNKEKTDDKGDPKPTGERPLGGTSSASPEAGSTEETITEEDKEDLEDVSDTEIDINQGEPTNLGKEEGDLLDVIGKTVKKKTAKDEFDKKAKNSNKLNWGSSRKYEIFPLADGSEAKRTTSATREEMSYPRLESKENSYVGEEATLSIDQDYINKYEGTPTDTNNIPIKVEIDGEIVAWLPTLTWLTAKDKKGNYMNLADFKLEGGKSNAEFEIARLKAIRKSIVRGAKETTITGISQGTPIFSYTEVTGEPARRKSRKASDALPDPDIEFAVVNQGVVSFKGQGRRKEYEQEVVSGEGAVFADFAGLALPLWIDKISQNQAQLIHNAIVAKITENEEIIQAIDDVVADLDDNYFFTDISGLANLINPKVYTSGFKLEDVKTSTKAGRVFFHVDDRSGFVHIARAGDDIIYTSNPKKAARDNDYEYVMLTPESTELRGEVIGMINDLTANIDRGLLNNNELYEDVIVDSDENYSVDRYEGGYNEYLKTKLSTYIDGTHTIEHFPDHTEYIYFENQVTIFNGDTVLDSPMEKPPRAEELESPSEEENSEEIEALTKTIQEKTLEAEALQKKLFGVTEEETEATRNQINELHKEINKSKEKLSEIHEKNLDEQDDEIGFKEAEREGKVPGKKESFEEGDPRPLPPTPGRTAPRSGEFEGRIVRQEPHTEVGKKVEEEVEEEVSKEEPITLLEEAVSTISDLHKAKTEEELSQELLVGGLAQDIIGNLHNWFNEEDIDQAREALFQIITTEQPVEVEPEEDLGDVGDIDSMLGRDTSDGADNRTIIREFASLEQENIASFINKHSIGNFREHQVNHVVSVITHLIAKQIEGGELNVSRSFKIARKAFEKQREKLESRGDTDRADNFYKVLALWDQFVERARYSLQTIGYEVEKEGFVGEQSDYELTKFDDRARWSQSRKDTASSNLKLFLAHLPKEVYEIKEDGSKELKEYRSDFLDLPKYVPLDETFDNLLASLVNQEATIENYIEILDKQGDTFAPFKTLVKELKALPDTSTLPDEFIKAMSNQYLDLVVGLFQPSRNKHGEKTGMQFKPIHSDRYSATDMIYAGWVENLKNSDLVVAEEGELVLKEEGVEEIKQLARKSFKEGTLLSKKVPVIREILERLGVDLTEATWESILDPNAKVFSKKGKTNSQFRINKNGDPVDNTFLQFFFESLSSGEFSTSNPLTSGNMTSTFKRIAMIEYHNAPKLYASSYLDINSNSINPYQMHSLMSDSIRKLSDDDSFVENLKQFPFNRLSLWLKEENRGEVSIEYVDGVKNQDNKKGGDGSTLGSINSDLMSAVLYLGTVAQTQGKKGRYHTTAKSDKTNYPILFAPRAEIKINFDGETERITGIRGEARTELKNIIKAEFTRISSIQNNEQALKDSDINLGAYIEGGKHFLFFPELNAEIAETYIEKGVLTKKEFDKVWGSGEPRAGATDASLANSINIMFKIVEDVVLNESRALKEDWKKAGLIIQTEQRSVNTATGEKSSEIVIDTVLDNTYLDKHAKGSGLNQKLTFAATDMTINHRISMANEFMVVSGDPASAWKGEPNDSLIDNLIATSENMNKRLARDMAPRSKGQYDTDYFDMVVIKDPKVFSKEPGLQKLLGKMDIADAWELTTVKEHLRNMKADGQISKQEYDHLVSKIKPGKYYEFTSDELGKYFSPTKPVYTGHRSLPHLKVNLPIYTKSSAFPLLPQIFEGFQLDKLRQKMETNKNAQGNPAPIDRASFETANKLGVTNKVEMFEGRKIKEDFDLEFARVRLPRDGFGLQQDVPVKDKNTINVVSQANKLLFAGLRNIKKFQFEGKSYTGRELEVEKEKIRKSLLYQAETELFERLGIKINAEGNLQIEDISKIADVIKQQATNLGWSVTALDSLEATEDGSSFKLPIALSPNARAIESILMAQITGITLKQEMRGYSYVQGSSAGLITMKDAKEKGTGFTKTRQFFDDGLRFARKRKGKTTPADIVVPWNFKDENGELLDITDFTDDEGYIIDSRLPEEARALLGFRIPNQGHSSMLPMRIVGFLPPNSTLAIVPEEIVAQMGSDFDVDKLYTYAPNVSYNPDTKGVEREDRKISDFKVPTYKEKEKGELKQRETRRDLSTVHKHAPYYHIDKEILQHKYYEIFESVLTHPKVYNKITSPLEKDDLAEEKAKILSARKKGDNVTSLISYRNQRDYVLKQKGAGRMIGIAARANTLSSLLEDIQRTNLHFQRPAKDGPVAKTIDIKIGSGNNLLKLSTLSGEGKSTYEGEDRTVGDNISLVLSAAVDNTNVDILGHINFSPQLASVFMPLIMAKDTKGNSVNLGFASTLLNQPAVDAILESIEESESVLKDYVPGDALENAIDEVRRDLLDRKGKNYKRLPVSEKGMEEAIGKTFDDLSESELSAQIDVLNTMSELSNIGQVMRELQDAILSPATGGANSNVITALRGVQDAEELFDKGSPYIANLPDVRRNVEGDASEQSVAMDVIYKNVRKLTDALLPEYNYFYFPVLDSLVESTGKKYSNKQLNSIWKGVRQYLNSRIDLLNENRIKGTVESNRERLLFGTDTEEDLATRVRKAQTSWGSDNYFLRRIHVETTEKPGKVPSKVEFRADKSVRIDDFMNTMALSDLLTSPKPLESKLGEDLVLYNLITGGVQGPIEFAKYIPSEYLELLGMDEAYGNVETEGNIPFEILQHNPSLAITVTEDEVGILQEEKGMADLLLFPINKETARLTRPDAQEGEQVFYDYYSFYNKEKGSLDLYSFDSVTDEGVIFKRERRRGSGHVAEYGSQANMLRDREEEGKPPQRISPANEESDPKPDYSRFQKQLRGNLRSAFAPYQAEEIIVDEEGDIERKIVEIKTSAHDFFSTSEVRKVLGDSALAELMVEALKDSDVRIGYIYDTTESFSARHYTFPNDQPTLILFNLAKLNKNNFSEVTLHELIHEFTLEALDSKSGKYYQSMLALYNKASREITQRTEREEYALSSIDEFTTFAMTNKDFQERLNAIEFSGQKSMFERFLDIIENIIKEIGVALKLDVSEGSVLKVAIQETVSHIKDRPSGDYKKVPKDEPPPPTDDDFRGPAFEGSIVREMPTFGEAMEAKGVEEATQRSIETIESRMGGIYERLSKIEVGDPQREVLNESLENLQDDRRILMEDNLEEAIIKVAKSEAEWVKHIAKNINNSHTVLNNARKVANNWNWENTQQFLNERQLEDSDNPVQKAFIEAGSIMESAKTALTSTIMKKMTDSTNKDLPKEYRIKKKDLESMEDEGFWKSYFLDLSQSNNQLATYMALKMNNVHKSMESELTKMSKTAAEKIDPLTDKEKDDFKQRDELGNWTGRFIHEYSDKFIKLKDAIEKSKSINVAKAYKESKENRVSAINKAYKGYHEAINKLQETIDLRLLVYPKASTPLWKNKKEYVEHLKEEYGEFKAEQLMEQTLAQYKEYQIQRSRLEYSLEDQYSPSETELSKEEWVEKQLTEWSEEHDPLRYMDEKFGSIEGPINEYKSKSGKRYAVAVPRKTDKDGKDLGYYDTAFDNLNDKQKDFYTYYLNFIDKLRQHLPRHVQRNMGDNFFPQIRKDFLQTWSSDGTLAALEYAQSSALRSITASQNKELNKTMIEQGKEIDPSTGLPEDVINVLFTNTDIKAGDLSFNILANMQMFAATALGYKWKSQIEDEMLLGLSLIQQAKRIEKRGGSPWLDRFNRLIRAEEGTVHLSNSTEYHIKAMMYGEKRKESSETDITIFDDFNILKNKKRKRRMKEIELDRDELEKLQEAGKISKDDYEEDMDRLAREYRGELPAKLEENKPLVKEIKELKALQEENYTKGRDDKIKSLESKVIYLGGRNLVWSKVGDLALKYTQLKGMGWNLTAGIANIGFGMLSNLTWAAANTDFTSQQIVGSYGEVLRSFLPGGHNSKMVKAVQFLNVLFEVTETEYGKDRHTSKKSYNLFARKFTPYHIQRRTEFAVQAPAMRSHMKNKVLTLKNLKTGEAEDINLWDVYDKDMNWREEYEQPETWKPPHESELGSNTEFVKMQNKIIQANKYMHGNYDPSAPVQIKKYVAGRMLMNFRSWIPYGVQQRIADTRYDRMLGREFKGRYRTLYDVGLGRSIKGILGTLFRADEFAYGKKGSRSRLQQIDIDNIKMALREMQILSALLLIQLLLKAGIEELDDDSVESDILHVLANQFYRVEQDIYFYIDPRTFEEILRNPLPVMQTYNNFQSAGASALDYLFDSDYEGERLLKNVGRSLPFANQIIKVDYLRQNLHSD